MIQSQRKSSLTDRAPSYENESGVGKLKNDLNNIAYMCDISRLAKAGLSQR